MIELKGKYAQAKVFTDVVDNESISQVIGLLNQPYAEGSCIRMMPDISKYVKDDGAIILSGIIYMRADEVRDAIAKAGYEVVKEAKENDWLALMIKKVL